MAFKIPQLFSRKKRIQKVNVKPLEVKEISDEDKATIERLKYLILDSLEDILKNLKNLNQNELSKDEKNCLIFNLEYIPKILKTNLDELEDISNLSEFQTTLVKIQIEFNKGNSIIFRLYEFISNISSVLGLIDRQ